MKNIYPFALLIVLLNLPTALFAVTDSDTQAVDFSIRFYDKRIYYAETDPVYVRITITNNSPSSYRFKLADDRAFSVDFDIRSLSNQNLEPADTLIRKRTQSQHIFFREIAIEPGEAFSFIEDLRDYANLKQPGAFVVQARVYPDLYRTGRNLPAISAGANGDASPARNSFTDSAGVTILESNRLNLNIRPQYINGPDGIPLAMDNATGAVLVRERLPPDQVVEYLLSARQKSQWEKFFLYLDLEAMLSRDAVRRRKWTAEGEDGRRRMLAEYRQEMQNSLVDGDIATIPSEFTVERTTYNSAEGTVTVLEKFRTGNFTEIKRYTYFLAQKDNVWTVVNYSVVNLGTE
ncbi:MAG TPA: hypothetical protein DEQ14_09370 [Treponema sp.]|nr:hypothetical protein [Treponema sp.]